MPSLYEQFGRHAKVLRHHNQIGLMRLKEPNEGCKKRGLASSSPKLVCPDSGQVDEALSPPRIAKRCCKRTKSNGDRVVWT